MDVIKKLRGQLLRVYSTSGGSDSIIFVFIQQPLTVFICDLVKNTKIQVLVIINLINTFLK